MDGGRRFAPTNDIGFRPFTETVSDSSGLSLQVRAVISGILVVSLLAGTLFAQQSPVSSQAPNPPADTSAQTPNPAFGSVASYLGLAVREIRFGKVADREKA